MAITIESRVVLISNVIPCLGYVCIIVMVMDDIVHMPPRTGLTSPVFDFRGRFTGNTQTDLT
jgi:hypothetical protein